MKKFILFALTIFLTSCGGARTSEISSIYSIPKEMSDCSIYFMTDGKLSNITVVRCPNSSTSTTTHEKNSRTSIVIESEKDTVQEQIQKLEKLLIELKKNRKE